MVETVRPEFKALCLKEFIMQQTAVKAEKSDVSRLPKAAFLSQSIIQLLRYVVKERVLIFIYAFVPNWNYLFIYFENNY